MRFSALIAALAALAALAACKPAEQAPPPPPAWAYPAPAPAWQLGPLRGRFGRSQPPQRIESLGIAAGGGASTPLQRPTVWSVPGDGDARAVVFGYTNARPAVELVDIDRGAVAWRSTDTCVEPVVGVTAKTIVCGGARGVRTLGLDGKPRWHADGQLLAVTGDALAIAKGDRDLAIVDAGDGQERWRATLPDGVTPASVVGSCGDDAYALAGDRLQRISDGRGGAAIAWQTTLAGSPVAIDTIDTIECSRDAIVVATREAPSSRGPRFAPPAPSEPEGALYAIARATGKVTGRVGGVRGHWRARDGSDAIEVASAAGVVRWPNDLSGPVRALSLPPLGAVIDARGDRRLVRATPSTAVLLDRDGVRAVVPLAGGPGATLPPTPGAPVEARESGPSVELGSAALGAETIIAALGPRRAGGTLAASRAGGATGTSAASPASTLRRFAIPSRLRRVARVVPAPVGVAIAAELRDLPPSTPLAHDRDFALPERPGAVAIALDPIDPALYVIARNPSAGPSAVARADLAARTFAWSRDDGCGPGEPVGLAATPAIVVCAARGPTPGSVRATGRDGHPRWEWSGAVDGVTAAGDAVIAFAADRATVLDAATGAVRGRLTSDDGAAVRAAVVTAATTTWVIAFERGRLVARIPAVAMAALWSLDVAGVVRSIQPSGSGVLVVLEDGDAYRVDLAGEVTPLPGLGLRWRASGELITGETTGGPVPGAPRAAAAPEPPENHGRAKPRDPETDAPRLWVPIPAPPPSGDSWQYTLYERAGGLRARNDYGLAWPVQSAPARGPSGSPLVVVSGSGLREVLVIDPRSGDPIRRATLSDDAVPGLVFGTIVDGTPVSGAVLANPLRIVVF